MIRKKIAKYIIYPLVLYFLISIIIIFQVFQNGKYIFSLDRFPDLNNKILVDLFYGKLPMEHGNGLLLTFLLSLLPKEIYQSFLLFIILFFSGVSAYYLVPVNSKIAKLYAGLLYMLNPFTYVRIVVGQWGLLLPYAFLPFGIKFLIELLENRNIKSAVKLAIITTIIAHSSHIFVIALLAYLIIFIVKIFKERDIKLVKIVLISAIMFLLLNIYWILSIITMTKEESWLKNISILDLMVFLPKIESYSIFFTLASMYGFWRPAYIYAKDFLPYWYALFIIILYLAVYGFISNYKDRKIGIYVKSFSIIALVGLILSAGAYIDFFKILFENLPIFKGMRDTHRFVILIILAYAYLGSLTLHEISRNKKKLAVIFLIIPLIYSFTFFNGFAGQIKATDFPKDWYKVNKFLNKDKDDFKVLFFPWHLHMDLKWNPNIDKRTAMHVNKFFDKEVISGKNIEAGPIYRQVYTPVQLYIDYLLANKNKIDNFGELVSILNVKYILLTKEADYKKYFFLFNQSDLEPVMETENFYVFRNKAYISRVFSTDSKICVKNMSEFLELSREIDIRKTLVIINESCGYEAEGRVKELRYTRVSPVKYAVKNKPLKYIVLAEEYHRSWRMDGKESIKAYGAVNAWKADEGVLEIKYQRFYKIYLPAYILSAITFLLLSLFYIRESNNSSKI